MSTAPLAAERRPAQAALLLLAMTSLFWGLNWPVMKLALTGIPVLPFRAICLLVAGPTMLTIARLRGDSLRLSRGEALRLTLAAFFNVTLWHLSTAYGVSKMPAGRASIIAYTMPAWASLFGALFLGEKLTWSRVAALVLGMGGVAALLLPELHAIRAAPLGAASMILAALSWAAGTVVTKRYHWTGSVAALTGWQICLGGAPIVAAALIIGPFPGLARADAETLAALGYVIFCGMVIGQWGWFAVLARLPVARASIGTLAIPIIGVLSSTLLLGERLGPPELVALALVVAALSLALRPGAPARS
ncbi:MAG TPA: DMT family transporter [Stellaceae bacterium]|nr:DMT family transporter [Stellaceae bacterium]